MRLEGFIEPHLRYRWWYKNAFR